MRTLPILCALLFAAPVLADEKKAAAGGPLVETLQAFFADPDPASRAAKGLRLAASGATPADVAAALPAARTWPADVPKGGVETWRRETAEGVAHTVLANIPESYDAAKAWPVLIWLHGGVARPTDGGGVNGIRLLKERSDEEGFLLLAPSARQGAEWWTPAGVGLVRGALDDLKARWHVDADRVAVSGFSDGASACFHLLAHDPDPYCCFLPMMAHPGVTRLAGGPCFAANVGSRPVFAVNGGADALYPSVQIKPMIEELRQAGADVTWIDMPEVGHDIQTALPAQWEAMAAFWKAHPRTALPASLSWESALPARDGRFGWVEILAIDPQAPSADGLQAALLPDPTGRPKLGIQIDMDHRDEGIRLRVVQPDSAAADAGFEVGDVILAVDGRTLGVGGEAFATLRRALDALGDRDGVFRVLRGEDVIELAARPRVVASTVPKPAELGYGLASGRVVAEVEGNEIRLRTRHVKRLKLHLADGLVDLSRPVRVVVNGRVRHDGEVPGDVGYLLTQAVRAGPGAPVFRSHLTIGP